MKKSLSIIIFMILIFFVCFIPSNSDECKPPPPPPGNDNPDDNFGFASFQGGGVPSYFDAFPFVGIFFNGYHDSTDALLTRLKRGCFCVKEEFDPIAVLDKAKVLIIPSGGLCFLSAAWI
jgi:hypothetical protein